MKRSQTERSLSIKEKMVVMYLPFLLAWEPLIVAYGRDVPSLPIIRGMIVTVYLVFLLLSTNMQRKFIRSVWYFVFYIMILLLFADNPIRSLNGSSKVIISMLSIAVGYHYVHDDKMLRHVSRVLFACFAIVLMNQAIGTIFGFGRQTYSKDVELLRVTGWNTFTYLILVFPLYYMHEEKRTWKNIFSIMLVAAMILVITSFKRASIAGVGFGLAIFSFYYRKYIKILKYFFIIVLSLVALWPLYDDMVHSQFLARESKFEEGSLQEEGRYREFELVWGDVLSFEDPVRSVLGLNPFDTVGRYGGGIFGNRVLHVDYNKLLLTTGIIGLVLYLLVFCSLYTSVGGLKRKKISDAYSMYQGVFWALFLTSLFTSLTGHMEDLSYRPIQFFFFGVLVRTLNRLEICHYPKNISNRSE